MPAARNAAHLCYHLPLIRRQPAGAPPFHSSYKSYRREHSFFFLPLAEQLANLNELGYAKMTPVQAARVAAILQGGGRAAAKTVAVKRRRSALGLLFE